MDVLLRVRQSRERLSASERRVADAVLDDPDLVRTATIMRLADVSGASQSTVARFCQSLGYPGYREFRLDVISALSRDQAQRVSFGDGTYNTPAWSPKGDYIAFTKQGGGDAGPFSIGIMAPDGSGEKILYSGFHAEGPTWAPNSRVLMYFSDPGGDSGPSLYTVDVWGRANNKLSTTTYASDPAWGPLRS